MKYHYGCTTLYAIVGHIFVEQVAEVKANQTTKLTPTRETNLVIYHSEVLPTEKHAHVLFKIMSGGF